MIMSAAIKTAWTAWETITTNQIIGEKYEASKLQVVSRELFYLYRASYSALTPNGGIDFKSCGSLSGPILQPGRTYTKQEFRNQFCWSDDTAAPGFYTPPVSCCDTVWDATDFQTIFWKDGLDTDRLKYALRDYYGANYVHKGFMDVALPLTTLEWFDALRVSEGNFSVRGKKFSAAVFLRLVKVLRGMEADGSVTDNVQSAKNIVQLIEDTEKIPAAVENPWVEAKVEIEWKDTTYGKCVVKKGSFGRAQRWDVNDQLRVVVNWIGSCPTPTPTLVFQVKVTNESAVRKASKSLALKPRDGKANTMVIAREDFWTYDFTDRTEARFISYIEKKGSRQALAKKLGDWTVPKSCLSGKVQKMVKKLKEEQVRAAVEEIFNDDKKTPVERKEALEKVKSKFKLSDKGNEALLEFFDKTVEQPEGKSVPSESTEAEEDVTPEDFHTWYSELLSCKQPNARRAEICDPSKKTVDDFIKAQSQFNTDEEFVSFVKKTKNKECETNKLKPATLVELLQQYTFLQFIQSPENLAALQTKYQGQRIDLTWYTKLSSGTKKEVNMLVELCSLLGKLRRAEVGDEKKGEELRGFLIENRKHAAEETVDDVLQGEKKAVSDAFSRLATQTREKAEKLLTLLQNMVTYLLEKIMAAEWLDKTYERELGSDGTPTGDVTGLERLIASLGRVEKLLLGKQKMRAVDLKTLAGEKLACADWLDKTYEREIGSDGTPASPTGDVTGLEFLIATLGRAEPYLSGEENTTRAVELKTLARQNLAFLKFIQNKNLLADLINFLNKTGLKEVSGAHAENLTNWYLKDAKPMTKTEIHKFIEFVKFIGDKENLEALQQHKQHIGTRIPSDIAHRQSEWFGSQTTGIQQEINNLIVKQKVAEKWFDDNKNRHLDGDDILMLQNVRPHLPHGKKTEASDLIQRCENRRL